MRRRIHQILELAQPDDRSSRRFDIFIVALISLNILALVLESVQEIHRHHVQLFFWFEVFSVGVFTVEYLLRIWSCVEAADQRFRHPLRGRLRFALTPMALVDLCAILPFYLGMIYTLDLRFLRALRLLRIFKLTRYSTAMSTLLQVLRDEAQSFGAAFLILFIIMIIASSGVYLFEHKAQPEAFSNIPEAAWWSVATLTTVGYGDVTPITTGGKIFGIFIMIIGIGMVALPAGILASAFSEELRKRRMQYRDLAESVLADGMITPQERANMEATRIRLGLSSEDAGQIFARMAREELLRSGVCPHCHRPLQPTAADRHSPDAERLEPGATG
ncbi:MAG: ion transporter [Pseudomonadota bacterium]